MTFFRSIEVFNGHMVQVETLDISSAEICYYNRPSPLRQQENHDSLWIALPNESCFLLCVADGAGGHRTPSQASASLLTQIKEYLDQHSLSLDSIIHAIENANQYIRHHFNQSRSTLVMAIIDEQTIRSLHIGDSKLVIIGGRGKLKYESIGHNLYEISTDSGLIDYIDRELEVPSHVVTNMIGDPYFRMDVSTKMELAPNDTIVIGSDGLFDNISMEELCEDCRNFTTLSELAESIRRKCDERMETCKQGESEYKADDLSFIFYRRKSATNKED
ncbi:MAG: PP2C family protein-serine/threonine phosphatase [Oligoflexus sp.]